MRTYSLAAATVVAAITLTGCATLPRDHGYAETRSLVQSRLDTSPTWSPNDPATRPRVPDQAIDAETALRLAFTYNPAIREQFARLGLGRAEIEDARRIANPSFGFSRLEVLGPDGAQITRSLSFGLADTLLLSSRKRLAAGEFERLQAQVANALLNLAAEVESAWLNAVSAAQAAKVRSLIADASQASMTLAQRFFDAGNISRLQLAQEQAAASQARVAATRAAAEALRARFDLAEMLGLNASDEWTIQNTLEAPIEDTLDRDALLALALEQRLDLRAARMAMAGREDAFDITRRWRWFGSVELGFESESEPDGGRKRGPSLDFELPIFSQGQGQLARADAELLEAIAAYDALDLRVRNELNLAVEGVLVSRQILEAYRQSLLPQLETVLDQSQKEVNYMLMGVFELLQSKQNQYDAYQEYLHAVRDYWLARTELKRVVGGRLPSDDVSHSREVIGVEAILPARDAPMMMDHSAHGGMQHGDMQHEGMDHSEMKRSEMNHDDPSHESKNHEGMNHQDMQHEGMQHKQAPSEDSQDDHEGHGAHRPSAPKAPPTAEQDHHHSHGGQP